MLDKEILSFRVNGVARQAAVRPHQTLLEALREELGLTGTKEGCDDASCGACTVLLDGEPVLSCVHVALLAEGTDVTTIEGASRDGHLSAVQEALIESGGLQCGYCTPGIVLAAHSLLSAHFRSGGRSEPCLPLDRERIRAGLSNNLCRCTGYERIVSAVELAVSRLAGLRQSPATSLPEVAAASEPDRSGCPSDRPVPAASSPTRGPAPSRQGSPDA